MHNFFKKDDPINSLIAIISFLAWFISKNIEIAMLVLILSVIVAQCIIWMWQRDNVKPQNKVEIIKPDDLSNLIIKKAKQSKVFNSIETDKKGEILYELVDAVYPRALDFLALGVTPQVFDEKLNYLIHAKAYELKSKNKTKK